MLSNYKSHAKNTVRYYLLIIVLLAFLFFSGDFGLIDVQKTAIVMAAGIDREEGGFLLTSQIAIPQSSQQGKSSEAVQLVSRGKTVAEAFEQINAKTGWYPKLVFCKLIVFGESAARENVFDGLDFFLRDEYLADDCQLAVCKGQAKDLLNTTALVDPSSSVAMSKVLSPHAERVGTVHANNLKDFSIGYFGDSRSGLLPILKTEPQQEATNPDFPQKSPSSGSSAESGGESGQGGESGGKQDSQNTENKPVFSARETALFVGGKWRETLTAEETFAVDAAVGKLRLAVYSVDNGEESCSLVVKRNQPKLELDVGKEGRGLLKIELTMFAGIADYSKAQNLLQMKDAGSPPDGVYAAAEKKLAASLTTAYEKARGVGCDVFGLQERLVKYKKREYLQHKDTIVNDTALRVEVRFKGVR